MIPSNITLITGGARSGKSAFAEKLAQQRAGDDVLFIATAEALDDEMRERIAQHRAERPPAWHTLEAARELPEAIRETEWMPRLILLDCLTLWVTNELLGDDSNLERRLFCQLDLITDWVRFQGIALILISNEVGSGIVPDNALSRRYRDTLGRVNAYVADKADQVYLMVAGLPLEIKSLVKEKI
jgi:adenosylcobinamide kinase/adenosylcobinamide-phosphate guanylyltransferase